jgi:hypothetical protein
MGPKVLSLFSGQETDTASSGRHGSDGQWHRTTSVNPEFVQIQFSLIFFLFYLSYIGLENLNFFDAQIIFVQVCFVDIKFLFVPELRSSLSVYVVLAK